ncbi:MAG: DEAD/DEAH box helicase, partial [Candidatus Bathyarchaeia archaeon]
MNTLVETYQALVLKELKEKLEPKGWNFEDPTTYLSEKDLINSYFIRDLINKGLLIRYRYGFRTAHADLLYRLTKIRYFRNREPIPLERDFSVIEEQVPDFGAYSLINILRLSNIPETDSLLIENAIKAGDTNFNGLSTYQAKYLESILKGVARYFSVVAPTASGKSLIFFIPILVSALQRLRERKPGTASIIMYPRKALATDQIQRFLRAIDFLNQKISNKLTIAIDDSDTLKIERKLRERESIEFRGLTCPRSNEFSEKVCGHKLLLYNNGTIKCEMGHSFEYIVARRRDIVERKPMILVTNIWRAYYMMLKRNEVNLLQNIDILVMDESHVYTGYKGGHIALVLQLLRYLSSLNQEDHLTKFIFSSATISNPKQFISSLAGISEEELFYQDYAKLTPFTSKKRLLIYVYLLPSPRESAETLAEAIIEAVNLWNHKYGFKAIAFADSVSTVTTFLSYFHDTILSSKREAREIIDHVFDNNILLNNPDDDYSWYTLTPLFTEKEALKKFLL